MRLNMVGEQDYHTTYGSIIPFMLTVTASFFSFYYAFFLINSVYEGGKVQYKSIEYANFMTPFNRINNALDDNKDSPLDIQLADKNFLPYIEARLQNIEVGDFDKYDIFDEQFE